jgi:hypothetical protein
MKQQNDIIGDVPYLSRHCLGTRVWRDWGLREKRWQTRYGPPIGSMDGEMGARTIMGSGAVVDKMLRRVEGYKGAPTTQNFLCQK